MLLQYFINYNMKKGWYISLSPILTANWMALSGNVWTIPFGGGIGPMMNLLSQPVNLTAQVYGNAVHPAGAYGGGVIYKLTQDGGGWTYTDLYDFTGGSDGGEPNGSLVFDGNGNLYGTTQYDGVSHDCGGAPYEGCGVVFELTP